MVGGDTAAQHAVIARAIESGVRFFDTAQLYGAGESERRLGGALRAVAGGVAVAVSTKVDVADPDMTSSDVRGAVAASLRRLRRDRLDLLLLHNRVISGYAGARPVHAPGPALTVDELLRPDGVLAGLVGCRDAGLAARIGLTGLGSDESAVGAVIARSGVVEVLTVESNLLNQTAVPGRTARAGEEADYSGMASIAYAAGVTLLGLRPLAGGLLTGRPDADGSARTAALVSRLRDICVRRGLSLSEAAWQFALLPSAPSITLGGFRNCADLEPALSAAASGPDTDLLAELTEELSAPRHEGAVR